MKRIYTVSNYLEYKLLSSHKKGHGIHSPFLFSFITDVLGKKVDRQCISVIEERRKLMKKNGSTVLMTDYGSKGTPEGRKYERKISAIAGRSSVPPKYGRLLYCLSGEFGGENILELGTSSGFSAMYLAAGNDKATVRTLEGCREIADLASENFISCGFRNIKLITGRFSEELDRLKASGLKPDLVFVDGDHRKERVAEYFETLYSMSHDRTVIVFDDIHSTWEMGEAWRCIASDSRVTLAVDLFRMGIVFFRRGLTPASVVIRY